MIRFDALFSTVLASSFCAANRNTHTHNSIHSKQSTVNCCPSSGKCWPRRSVGRRLGWKTSARTLERWRPGVALWWRQHDSVTVNGRDDHSEQTAKTLAEVTFDDPSWSVPRTAQLITTKSTLAMAAKWTAVRLWPTNLSWHISFSCLASRQRGSKRVQNWHGAGSSEIAFSTARLRLHNVRLISQRQPGHVAVSSLRRASANRCERQLAHIRWPFVHCNSQTDSRDNCNCRRLTLLHCCNTVQKWSNICINQVKKIYKHTDVNKKSMSCHYNTRYNKLWDTWKKLVPMGNTEGRNGYYVTNDVTVGWRSFCLHTFGIFREDKMSLIQSKCMN